MKTRREFLTYGCLGLASLASYFIPGKAIAKDLFADGNENVDIYQEDQYVLRLVILDSKKGVRPLISGKATPRDKRQRVQYFSHGIDLKKYKKDRKYTTELLRRINHNLRVTYKYA